MQGWAVCRVVAGRKQLCASFAYIHLPQTSQLLLINKLVDYHQVEEIPPSDFHRTEMQAKLYFLVQNVELAVILAYNFWKEISH